MHNTQLNICKRLAKLYDRNLQGKNIRKEIFFYRYYIAAKLA